jgi:hypothetical protein
VLANPRVLHQVFDSSGGVGANAGAAQSCDPHVGRVLPKADFQLPFQVGIQHLSDILETLN